MSSDQSPVFFFCCFVRDEKLPSSILRSDKADKLPDLTVGSLNEIHKKDGSNLMHNFWQL